jgi:hypothetical protein
MLISLKTHDSMQTLKIEAFAKLTVPGRQAQSKCVKPLVARSCHRHELSVISHPVPPVIAVHVEADLWRKASTFTRR